jgi:hypothetical protein
MFFESIRFLEENRFQKRDSSQNNFTNQIDYLEGFSEH